MRHAPFFSQPVPIELHFEAGWVARLRADQPALRLGDAEVERLRNEVWCYVATLYIDQHKTDTKAVQEQLEKFKRRAEKILEATSIAQSAAWTEKLSAALRPPLRPQTGTERARVIAVDRMAHKFFSVGRMRSGMPLASPRGDSAHQVLERQDWTDANLQRLCRFLDQATKEVARDNAETRRSVEPAIGKLILNGKPFEFVEDPARERGFDGRGKALAQFAKQMVLHYRCLGGDVRIHRHWEGEGSPAPTPFMNFLSALCDAVPETFRPKGTSLHSRAHAFVKTERHLPGAN
jgi:hypothetical protein